MAFALRAPSTVTAIAEQALERLASELDISDTHYESAERSYNSVGNWLSRPGSAVAKYKPTIYSQGSFRLGTVIRPPSEEDCFDLDVVCEATCSKTDITQETLKNLIGAELIAYAKAHQMDKPEAGQWCWTLQYADSAQFQMDVLPAVPDSGAQRSDLAARKLGINWVDSAVGLTNREHPRFRIICADWPPSNPRGYANWFRTRMQTVFLAKRQRLALLEHKAKVEEIPDYRVKTPLQAAIQILKRHRDGTFVDRPDVRPASIIITSLAAHSYSQEETIAGALFTILARMHEFIEDRLGVPWIPNPVDGRENFANRWEHEPELRDAFYEWLKAARADFDAIATLSSDEAISDRLAHRMGGLILERMNNNSPIKIRRSTALSKVASAQHKLPLAWAVVKSGEARILKATVSRNGFRPTPIWSNGAAIAKHCSLKFDVETNVAWPYEIYWQVVNTGTEAQRAGGLRGTFEYQHVDRGHLTRRESTLYAGTHSIECFVIKNGYCVAQTGPFIVNIA